MGTTGCYVSVGVGSIYERQERMLEGCLVFGKFSRVRRGGSPVFYNRLESAVIAVGLLSFSSNKSTLVREIPYRRTVNHAWYGKGRSVGFVGKRSQRPLWDFGMNCRLLGEKPTLSNSWELFLLLQVYISVLL